MLYVGHKQTNETDILSNAIGSQRYENFLRGLGTLVKLRNTDNTSLIALAKDGSDGEECYVWRDELMQVMSLQITC